jgi:hypothetical protein
MDTIRFDALARLVGRRGIIRGMVGIAGLGGALTILPEPAAALSFCTLRATRATCKHDAQCCSGDCKRRKRRKRGKCRCSGLQETCSADTDCCEHDSDDDESPVCTFNGVGTVAVCCSPVGGDCEVDDDCCGTADCFQGFCSLL